MPKNHIKILYLDDEETNLSALKATLRRNFEVYTALRAEEAFRILEIVDINIILADQKMPEMTGIEFFERVLLKYPDPIRILITAYTNSQTIIEAVNKGQIFRYLVKPWEPDLLKSVIETSYETYKARAELKVKNDELVKRNDELSRFVYSISHDLRAPLMSILGLINVTEYEKTSASVDYPYYLGLMKQSVHKMDEYIKGILEYYQNARGETVKERINFQQLVAEVIDNIVSYNEKVQFEISIKDDHPYIGDPFRMQIILNNLISNAVKYQNPDSPNPIVRIFIEVTIIQVHIVIADNGIGILKDHLEKIFKIFFRSKNESGKTGVGIGLYIVKEALSRIEGTIDISSEQGEGTKIELHIPNNHE